MAFPEGLPAVPGDPDDPRSVEMISAALRADTADVDTLSRVLTTSLGESLPPGMVSVERKRSLGDRLAGRDGRVTSITVVGPEVRLHLAPGPHHGGAVLAEINTVVRGVVISRRQVGMAEWISALAQLLNELAAQNSAARASLSRLLEGNG